MALIQYVAKLAVDKDTGLPLPELQGQGGTIISRGNPSVIPTIYEDKDGTLPIPGAVLSVDGNGFVPSFWADEADLPISWWDGSVEVPLESMEGVAKRITEIGTEATAAKDAAVAAQAAAEDAAALVDAPADDAVALLMQDDTTDTGAIIEGMRPDGGGRPVGKGELVLNVRDYGAVGDGVTDDTAAIQAAFDVIRDYPFADTPGNIPVAVTGQGGTYRVSGSLNLTGVQGRGWVVRDLHIWADGAGKVVFDLSGSRYGHLKDVRIWADPSSRPHTGFLLARSADPASPCRNFYFDGVTTDGYFANSALHMNTCEESTFVSCIIANRAMAGVDGDAYALIIDGEGHKLAPSEFVTPVQEPGSTTVNAFYNCAIQKPFGQPGPVVFLTRVASVTFSACFMSAGSGPIVEWRLTDYMTYRMVFDVTIETGGLDRFIHFTSDAAAERVIRGLRIRFGNIMADEELFSSDTLTSLVLHGFKCHAYRKHGTPGWPNGMFNPASLVTVTGADIYVPLKTDFNLTPSKVDGVVAYGDAPTDWFGASLTAPGFAYVVRFETVGDSSFTYQARTLTSTRVGNAVFAEWRMLFTPTIGTGSGYLRIHIPEAAKLGGQPRAIAVAQWFGFSLPAGYTSISMEIEPGGTFGRFKISGPSLPLIDLDHTMLTDGVPAGLTFTGMYLTR